MNLSALNLNLNLARVLRAPARRSVNSGEYFQLMDDFPASDSLGSSSGLDDGADYSISILRRGAYPARLRPSDIRFYETATGVSSAARWLVSSHDPIPRFPTGEQHCRQQQVNCCCFVKEERACVCVSTERRCALPLAGPPSFIRRRFEELEREIKSKSGKKRRAE